MAAAKKNPSPNYFLWYVKTPTKMAQTYTQHVQCLRSEMEAVLSYGSMVFRLVSRVPKLHHVPTFSVFLQRHLGMSYENMWLKS